MPTWLCHTRDLLLDSASGGWGHRSFPQGKQWLQSGTETRVPSPNHGAWGVPWAGLAQAWHTSCALHPGTSCTQEDLLKGQRSHGVQAPQAQAWQLSQALAAAGTPTLNSGS